MSPQPQFQGAEDHAHQSHLSLQNPEGRLLLGLQFWQKIMQMGAHIKAFEAGVPQARIVLLTTAHHFLFITHQAEVVREMTDFLDSLP